MAESLLWREVGVNEETYELQPIVIEDKQNNLIDIVEEPEFVAKIEEDGVKMSNMFKYIFILIGITAILYAIQSFFGWIGFLTHLSFMSLGAYGMNWWRGPKEEKIKEMGDA